MSETMKKIDRNTTKKFIEQTAGVWALALLVLVFYLTNNAFLNANNIKNLFGNLATLLVMACGATLVRLCGSLDLSMGAVCSVANVLFVVLIPYIGAGAYLVAMAFGLFAGFLLGVVHAKLKMPSFIASLGFMNIWSSIALLIVKTPFSLSKQYRGAINWGQISWGFITLPTVFALALLLLFYLFQRYTVPGRSLNLIGGNERTARLSGIPIDRYKILAFSLCGLTSALTAIVLAVKLRSCDPTIGEPYTLQAVAAVLLGGTAATGGRGSMLKTLLGVAVVVVIHNGMTIIGVPAFWSKIVFGALVLVSMMLTSDRGSKNTIVK